jgi:apolipoprotein N-acyltransferase
VTLAILSAILYIFAFPNFNLSWLAWVALIPVSIVAHRSTPRQAFLWGLLGGTLAYCGILYWLVVTFQAAHLSIFLACLCLLLLAGYLGLYWGAWAWFIQRCSSPLAGAAAWVGLEYLRTYLFSGFPWALLADSQVKILPLIQIASLTGVYGVSFLIVWFNLAVAKGRPKPLVFALVAIVLTCLAGRYRLHNSIAPSPDRAIKVALLQGSIDQYKKWDKTYVDEIEMTYANLVTQAALSKPDMIIWPETSVPGYLLQDAALRDWLLTIIRKSGTDHLVGAPIIHNEIAYNSSFSINREGNTEGEYAKKHLVPFGEIVPWAGVLGRFIKVLNDLGGFAAGNLPPVLQIGGVPVGVNICYEAIFPNLVRQSVKQGACFIANLTNDGWYMRTAAPYQHWAPNIFRAVENNRWLVRADNTGVSGIIDPFGRVTAVSPIFQPLVLTGSVIPRQNLTPYTRYGDVFAWLCILGSLGALLV